MTIDEIAGEIQAIGLGIIAIEAQQQQHGRDPERTERIAALKAERAKLFVLLDQAKAAAAATE